jgi:hypothetical protein
VQWPLHPVAQFPFLIAAISAQKLCVASIPKLAEGAILRMLVNNECVALEERLTNLVNHLKSFIIESMLFDDSIRHRLFKAYLRLFLPWYRWTRSQVGVCDKQERVER